MSHTEIRAFHFAVSVSLINSVGLETENKAEYFVRLRMERDIQDLCPTVVIEQVKWIS